MKLKRIHWISFGVLFAVWVLSGSGIEKYKLEYQMKQLCKKDGGVKIYETVKLPPEKFNEFGDPFFGPFPPGTGKFIEGQFGPEYRYITEHVDLKKGDVFKFFSEGELSRNSAKIIRVSDGKLLGESVVYGRGGGETILLWHPSGHSCDYFGIGKESLIRSVFIKNGN